VTHSDCFSNRPLAFQAKTLQNVPVFKDFSKFENVRIFEHVLKHECNAYILCVYLFVYIGGFMHTLLYICIHGCYYVYVCINTYVYMLMYVHTCIHVHTHTHAHAHTCTHVHTDTHIRHAVHDGC